MSADRLPGGVWQKCKLESLAIIPNEVNKGKFLHWDHEGFWNHSPELTQEDLVVPWPPLLYHQGSSPKHLNPRAGL